MKHSFQGLSCRNATSPFQNEALRTGPLMWCKASLTQWPWMLATLAEYFKARWGYFQKPIGFIVSKEASDKFMSCFKCGAGVGAYRLHLYA